MDWLKDITIDDMPTADMEMVAHVCGLETAVLLMKSFAGAQLNIPKLWFKAVIERKIVQEYDGVNINRLTKRYGVSRAYIFKVLQESRRCRQPGASGRATGSGNGNGKYST
ncbi:MAG: Mor transcription activator family protein [Endomicrobiales bacterium]